MSFVRAGMRMDLRMETNEILSLFMGFYTY